MFDIVRELCFTVTRWEPSPVILWMMALVAIIFATTVHEFGHAWMADRLGDPGPREQKRVTLNPLAHLDPLGTLLLVVSMLIGFPIGWGKPVRTDPEKYRCGAKRGIAWVAAAGPLMNLLTAVVLAPITRFVMAGGIGRDENAMYVLLFLFIAMLVNLGLFAFNLVPIHPLDGSHIVSSFLPESLAVPYRGFMQRYGVYLLLILTYTGTLGQFVAPIVLTLLKILLGL
ncbi:MAG: site-2 protease family protein [Capsulimonadales bacterium]|nr:site-2 protease family protein [Capsulimonadales bacterium]